MVWSNASITPKGLQLQVSYYVSKKTATQIQYKQMKKLLIIRHAKSSWDPAVPKDFDRTLNERGHKDAPVMAKRLLKRDIEIDSLVSSPAVRALTTASYFAEAYDKKLKHITQVPALYHPSV